MASLYSLEPFSSSAETSTCKREEGTKGRNARQAWRMEDGLVVCWPRAKDDSTACRVARRRFRACAGSRKRGGLGETRVSFTHPSLNEVRHVMGRWAQPFVPAAHVARRRFEV
eukprot:31497-Pelagococcus_subviridis.AAC.31